MSFTDILYTILIGPLQLFFEVIYTIAHRFIGHPGLAIIVLSLIMNFLVLPLYKRADAMQKEARDIENKLQDGVAHIKKTFSGDERMMILQTYYRQNNYRPISALNGSISLLLQIPFFMAAYNFLSNLEVLKGVSLGPIVDLSVPDALITVGGNPVNVLPFLMTLINIISCAIFTKGFPLKTKIQLYGMAAFFLVFLYTSPSGLVFYWTLNNLFSLVKTLFYKLKNPKKVLNILFFVIGVLILYFGIFVYDAPNLKRKFFVCGLGLVLLVPFIKSLLEGRIRFKKSKILLQNDKRLFILGCIFVTILVGVLIPSNLIAASPEEFIDPYYFYNPMQYIGRTFCIAVGAFLIWMGVFYWLANMHWKAVFDKIVWILCGIMFVNYMFFGTNLGIISATLQYENSMDFELLEIIKNIVVLVLVFVIMWFVLHKGKKQLVGIVLTAILAITGMSGMNIGKVYGSVSEVMAKEIEQEKPYFNLSKKGKNVIVLMLDRAMGQAVPYIFNEKPELKEQFDGFTYYSNVISFGTHTNLAAPALFGGYEYTPVEMNKRDNELLVDKHNEALKVMPVLFQENGYDVTVCDPPYVNYSWIPELSIYDEYPNINAYVTEGKYADAYYLKSKKVEIEDTRRNFFCYSLMKTMPLIVQEVLYNKGNYNMPTKDLTEPVYSQQTTLTNTTAEGIKSTFMKAYNVLCHLPEMTQIKAEAVDTFLFMANDATHEQTLLQEPMYEPSMKVDNTQYYTGENLNRFTIDGKTLLMETDLDIKHYEVNMAAMIQLGKWFDYMRENDVYDNTRIIVVADHGAIVVSRQDGIGDTIEEQGDGKQAGGFFPLLLVKDFYSKGFSTSDTFMTNADVPVLATEGIIKNPTNPFTNKSITSEEKEKVQYLPTSSIWSVEENNGYTFLPSRWFTIKEDIWKEENWGIIDKEVILPEEVVE